MTLLQSWQNNIELLKPKNFKLLFLVAIKLMKDNAYVFVALAIVHGLVSVALFSLENAFLNECFPGIFTKSALFILVLCLRSSVGKKNIRYIRSYFRKIWAVILVSIVSILIRDNFSLFTVIVEGWFKNIWALSLLWFVFSSLIVVLYFLFCADERFSGAMPFLTSIWRMMKMCAYNTPLFLATLFLTFGAMVIPMFLLIFGDFDGWTSLGLLLIFSFPMVTIFWYFYIAFIITIYNKLIYDQRSLYWNE